MAKELKSEIVEHLTRHPAMDPNKHIGDHLRQNLFRTCVETVRSTVVLVEPDYSIAHGIFIDDQLCEMALIHKRGDQAMRTRESIREQSDNDLDMMIAGVKTTCMPISLLQGAGVAVCDG